MVKLKEELWKTLLDLKEDEFKHFKWFLEQENLLEGFSGIPVSRLEMADRKDTVDLMVQNYQDDGARELTKNILEKIGRNDLVSVLVRKDLKNHEKEQLAETKAEIKQMIQERQKRIDEISRSAEISSKSADRHIADSRQAFEVLQKSVERSLDNLIEDIEKKQETSRKQAEGFIGGLEKEISELTKRTNAYLVLSDDMKRVYCGDVEQSLPDNPERCDPSRSVLGKQSFSSGRFYYEVLVKGKSSWDLGVVKGAIARKGKIHARPQDGYWTICLREGNKYQASAEYLKVKRQPERVGVFVDYERGSVYFYDVDSTDLIHNFTDCAFTEKLYPFFSPGLHYDDYIERLIGWLELRDLCIDVYQRSVFSRPAVKKLLSPEYKALLFRIQHTLQLCEAIMAKIKEELWYILQHLKEDEFKHFKWFLEQENLLEGFSGIPVSRLETADRKDTVDLMVQNYLDDGARKGLGSCGPGLKSAWGGPGDKYAANENNPVDLSFNHTLKKVGVFVDYDEGLVSFYNVDSADLLYSFTVCTFIEKVQVKGKTDLLGVAKQSVKRKGPILGSPKYCFWTVWFRHGDKYTANENNPVDRLLEKVGVFVNYDEGLVSFYNVDSADLLHSFTGCTFTEKLNPYFSPCTNVGGVNSAPLIITPVDRPLNHRTQDFGGPEQCERKTAMPMKVLQSAVEVTLDADTAHPNLVLYDDGTQVYLSDEEKNLPCNPERFSRCVNVLGKQSFSSGRFYFEVQVKGKTDLLGVAKQSVKRKGTILGSPKYCFWTVWFRHGDKHAANENNPVDRPLEKVGVFVNYDEGLVSFYNVDSADLLYSFTGCTFTEKLNPYFSPCTNVGGVNSAPLIITPVDRPLNHRTQDFGVANQSVERKGQTILTPERGFWTVWLRHGDEYAANENNPVDLPFNRLLEKVGVFVDYDESLGIGKGGGRGGGREGEEEGGEEGEGEGGEEGEGGRKRRGKGRSCWRKRRRNPVRLSPEERDRSGRHVNQEARNLGPPDG
ncbi:hypothetical protein JOQ06_003898, partial [Pogonophryne albipinna]